MPDNDRSFFGRRKGKTLKPSRRQALDGALPALLLDMAKPAPAPLSDLFASSVDDIRLEIGFGAGEHLIHEATRLPDVGFIGVEPFRNSLAYAVARLQDLRLGNVRLHDDDAGPLLDWLPAGSLSRVDLLYPDPWPKPRHWKRRFVKPDNLDRIARVLRPGGAFRFAGDVPSYLAWTIREVARHGALAWTGDRLEACRTPWPDWPGTRYEAKALREGRPPAYLTFIKPALPPLDL